MTSSTKGGIGSTTGSAEKNHPYDGTSEIVAELIGTLQMARDALAAIDAHPDNPWKNQHGDGIPITVICDAILAKARGEQS